MKFDLQAFNDLTYKSETVYINDRQIRIQIRAWNIPQQRKAASYVKAFIDFFFEQKADKELSPEIFLSFFFDNIKDFWELIFITLGRTNQKCHLIDKDGNELKAFEGFDCKALDEMLSLEDQTAIVKAIYHLMIAPIFEMLKAGGEKAKQAKELFGEKKIVIPNKEVLRMPKEEMPV